MAGESARAAARSRRDRAERLLRSAETFERGAEGEEATARSLAALPSGIWRVFHDVRWPGRRRANLDHVVVGPAGVFVIDTKAWGGKVAIDGGVLRQNGRRRDSVVLGATAAALAVSELVPELDPEAVKPVLCFDRQDRVFGWVGEVMVCSTANVVTMLTSRPTVLDEAAVQAAAVLLHTSLQRASGGVPTPERPGRRGPANRARRRRQSRARSVAAILVVGLTALGVTVATPRVADVVEAEARERLVPTVRLGQTVTVKGNPLRPDLQITVDRLRRTRVVRPDGAARSGERVLAAAVTMRNTGEQTWVSGPATSFAVLERDGGSHGRDPRVAQVRGGPVLPARIRLRPGQTRRGLVVFSAPARLEPSGVRIAIDPGLARSVSWQAD